MNRAWLVPLALGLFAGLLSASEADLIFTPEAGARVENAAIPEAGLDAAGVTWLYYHVAQSGAERVATSAAGLTFPAGSAFTTHANDPRRVRLPDTRYRLFMQQSLPQNYDVSSQSSSDGSTFTNDAGIRYSPAPGDNGEIGIVEAFTQAGGDVVMLYLGDLHGKNNTRRARSTDGGNTFTYEAGNILGDDAAGGGSNSYVDITTLVLPDGRRRLFAMKGGQGIYSFISSDDGQTFTQEPGARLNASDFTAYDVLGLFDPSIVRLPDGRYRMYVAADIDLGSGNVAHRILSAVTQAPAAATGLQLASLKLKVFFDRTDRDRVKLSARLVLPDGLLLDGAAVTLDIGGVAAACTLDARGRGRSEVGTLALRGGARARLTAALNRGNFSASWLDEGLVNADVRGAAVAMPVMLSVGGQSYSGTRALVYSARAGRSGRAH